MDDTGQTISFTEGSIAYADYDSCILGEGASATTVCRRGEIAINMIASKTVDANDLHKVTVTLPLDKEEYDTH